LLAVHESVSEEPLTGGPAVFDALAVADYLVADLDASVTALHGTLGIEPPKPSWYSGGPGTGSRNTFCRVNRSRLDAPTVIGLMETAELDQARPQSDVMPHVVGLAALQGSRPFRTHGAPVAAPGMEELIESLCRRGIRHWVQPPSQIYPFQRVWMGITDGWGDYRPDGDGGLLLELVERDALGLPPEAYGAAAPADDAPDGSMLSIVSRGFLVADLARSLDQLAETFGWRPEQGPERALDGSRRAVLGFRMARSARIELIEPAGAREEAEFLRQWGPGVWHTRIAVKNLDAKAEDLRSRGTTFREVQTGFSAPELVLRVDPTDTPGCLFEFMEGR
jgi:hypothetical protein